MHKFAIQWNLTSSHMTWRISGRGKSTDWYFWVLISCGLFMIRIWYMITVKVLCCVNINRSLKWTKVGHCFRNGDCRNLTSIRFLACLWNAPSIVVCLRKVGFPFFFFTIIIVLRNICWSVVLVFVYSCHCYMTKLWLSCVLYSR